MPKKILIIYFTIFFISLLLVSFSHYSAVYAETVIEVAEDGKIYLITTQEGMVEPVVEEVTVEELADIYYNQPERLPQDDGSLNTVRDLIVGYEPTQSDQEGGLE